LTICLDPGHGGRDPGAVALTGARESTLALLLARRMKEGLVRAGHRVVWTRTGDQSLTLADRVAAADREASDLFISIHCNAGAPAASGVEWIVAKPDSRSRALAERWEKALLKRMTVKSRGVKSDTDTPRRRLYVLRENYRRRPAILIEAGFITNAAERELLEAPAYGLALGDALAEALRGPAPR